MSLLSSYKNVIVLISLVLIISFFLLSPDLMEVIYGQFIFQLMRMILIPFSWIPFPVVYLLIPALIYVVVKIIRGKQKKMRKLGSFGLLLTSSFFLFFLLWAFNYKRIDFSKRYPTSNGIMDSLSLFKELIAARNDLIHFRPTRLQQYRPHEIEKLIRPSVKKYCSQFGYSAPGNVRVKTLPAGSLLRIKTAGFYLPYAGEAYVDCGLHAIQFPFTQAHEMCHGYGVTDEGACNFIAYLATIHSLDSTIRYSGAMGYYRYVAGEYRYYYPKQYQPIRDSLPQMIQTDLEEINKQMIKYPDIFPKWRDKIYNKYLTSLNVPGGMASYDKIIDYVRQARLSGLLKE